MLGSMNPALRSGSQCTLYVVAHIVYLLTRIERMDHHVIATVSIVGICFDVLGSLYLAYDLLGGQHGPLRLLTRAGTAGTYSLVFGIGYSLGLGLFFGLVSGAA